MLKKWKVIFLSIKPEGIIQDGETIKLKDLVEESEQERINNKQVLQNFLLRWI